MLLRLILPGAGIPPCLTDGGQALGYRTCQRTAGFPTWPWESGAVAGRSILLVALSAVDVKREWLPFQLEGNVQFF